VKGNPKRTARLCDRSQAVSGTLSKRKQAVEESSGVAEEVSRSGGSAGRIISLFIISEGG
jgi:hypothetical protein